MATRVCANSPRCLKSWMSAAMALRCVLLVHVVKHDFLQFAKRHWTRQRIEVGNRLVARHEPHPLMFRREKVAVPNLRARVGEMLCQHDERRQVRIESAEAIA